MPLRPAREQLARDPTGNHVRKAVPGTFLCILIPPSPAHFRHFASGHLRSLRFKVMKIFSNRWKTGEIFQSLENLGVGGEPADCAKPGGIRGAVFAVAGGAWSCKKGGGRRIGL
jgi:hypothetical protein